MSERTAIITGGAAGIGHGLTLHFARNGWRAVALDRDEQALAELRDLVPESQFLAIPCDVGAEKDVLQAFERIAAWTNAAHLLVNNAGIADPFCGPLEDLSLDRWQGWVDASLTSAFLCSREALPLLRAGAPAAIVNISSTRALQSEPDCFAYAAAKGGLCALTHAMAVSLGPEIRVNSVLPGWIETGPWQRSDRRSEPEHSREDRAQHPVGRVGRVEDIADAVAWLAGKGAGFVTGQEIVVDGGMTRRMIYAD